MAAAFENPLITLLPTPTGIFSKPKYLIFDD